MRELTGYIRFERAGGVACDEPDNFGHTAEVRAMKARRYSGVGRAAVVSHAREAIDDDFGVSHRGRCRRRLDECGRDGCDDPVNGLHNYLPLAGRRNAPAWRKGTLNLPL